MARNWTNEQADGQEGLLIKTYKSRAYVNFLQRKILHDLFNISLRITIIYFLLSYLTQLKTS